MNVRLVMLAMLAGAASAQSQAGPRAPAWEGPLSADVSIRTLPHGGFRGALTVTGARLTSGPSMGGNAATGSGALAFEQTSWGAWASGGGESVWRTQPSFATPVLASGLWRRLKGVVFELTTARRQARFDHKQPTSSTLFFTDSTISDTGGVQFFQRSRIVSDTNLVTTARAWTETEGRVSWSAGRVALGGVVGLRPSTDLLRHATWGYGEANLHLTGALALKVGAGARREAVAGPMAYRRFLTVAVQMNPLALRADDRNPDTSSSAPARAGFSVTKVEGGKYLVRVLVPTAATVELSGDFNGWQPVRLLQSRVGVWEVPLAITPGSHQVNIRIDGAQWVAPPGLPTIADEFKGTVGIIVVR